jgi:type VI secretion system protein ImpK
MGEYGDTFLLGPFREFYKEVIRLKQVVVKGGYVAPSGTAEQEAEVSNVARGKWFFVSDATPGAEGYEAPVTSAWVTPPGDQSPPWTVADAAGNGSGADAEARTLLAPSEQVQFSAYVWQCLVSLFERQEAQAWRYGGTYGAEFYKEAQYVMVALADEIFLHTAWDGQRLWVSNLLETRKFRTHVAGELFFQKLERLLVERDPVNRDLAAVYLMALSLGFQGKYRGRDDRGQLERYRRQLFAFVFRREPELKSESRHVFPEAYYHTLREETRRKLPNPRAWVILFCAVVLAYVALTHGIWVKLTGRLFQVNERIEQTVDELGHKR